MDIMKENNNNQNYFSFPKPIEYNIQNRKDKSFGTRICSYIAYLFKKINIFKFNRKSDLSTPLNA